MPPLIRYAASGILRNRRRTLSSILGVLLAVTFVAGTFIAIDSSARSALTDILATIPGDFSWSSVRLPGSTDGNGSSYRDAVAGVPGVLDVSVYRSMSVLVNSTAGRDYVMMYGILPTHLGWEWRNAGLSGSWLLPNGTVAVVSDFATQIGARLGDRLAIGSMEWTPTSVRNYSLNFTVAAIYTPPDTSSYLYGPPSYRQPEIAVNLRDYDWILRSLNLTEYYPSVMGEIWIDHGRFVNPYDMTATNYNLQRLGRQIDSALAASGASNAQSYDRITSALERYYSQITGQRLLYLLLSLPVVLLGLYLGAVGVDLGHAERRRELAVLKTRGAGLWQIAGLLILEAVLGGLFAAVIGLVAGVVLSRLLMGVVNPYGAGLAPAYTDLFLSPETVVTVTLLSVLFMGVVSYRSARRTAGLPLGETLRYYAPGETRIKYSPFLDLALIAYGAAGYVVVAVMQTGPGNIFVFFVGFIFLFSMPVIPLILSVAVTRLATRATGRVYGWTARIWRPVSKDLEHVVARNLVRNPRRASNVAIIIALGLAFGLFAVSVLSSQQAYLQRQVRAAVGADVSVDAPYAEDATFEQNLTAIPGVARVSHVLESGEMHSMDGQAAVVVLDPSSYFAAVDPEPAFLEPSNPTQAYGALATPGEVLITNTYAQALGYALGDVLTVVATYSYPNGTWGSYSVNVYVGAIVRYMPGTGSVYGYYGGPAPQAVYASYDTLTSILAKAPPKGGFPYYAAERYLVSLTPGADWKAVKAAAFGIGSPNVQVYQEIVQASLSDPFMGSVLGFIKMEIAFIVVILTVGLALIIYAASLERDVEFAGIIARGASGWQTANLLVGEAFSIMLIGLAAGGGIGLLSSVLFVQYFFGFGYSGAQLAVPYLTVFPIEGLLLLIVAPTAMLLAALGVSWRTARMNVARVLKMRGG